MLMSSDMLDMPVECLIHILKYVTNFYQTKLNLKKVDTLTNIFSKYNLINSLSDVCLIFKQTSDNELIKRHVLKSITNPAVLNDELLITKDFSYVQYLALNDYPLITNKGLKTLKSLKELSLNDNITIDDEGIVSLVNLETLSLCGNDNITDESIKYLTNIKYI